MIKTSFLKDVVVTAAAPTGKKPGFANAEPKIGYVSAGVVVARERDAARQEHERVQRLGKGVTKEGQEIFDALSRT